MKFHPACFLILKDAIYQKVISLCLLIDWSSLTELNLSRNNFVSLPDCVSKVVNLEILYLRDCKRLREILVLPPKLKYLYLDNCTSLEKIPRLPPRINRLSLCNCFGLSGDEVAKLENNLLNAQVPSLFLIK